VSIDKDDDMDDEAKPDCTRCVSRKVIPPVYGMHGVEMNDRTKRGKLELV
jgi:hypothetical protein